MDARALRHGRRDLSPVGVPRVGAPYRARPSARSGPVSDVITQERAQALLTREAHLLDARRWDEWLALYEAEAVFWVPSWRDDGTPIEDPNREVSFIYHE